MLCPSCQHNVPDNTAFCPTCGHKFSAAQGTRKQTVTPVPTPAPVTYGKMTFGGSIKSVFSNYFGFEGRASRAEFWFWILFCAIVNIPLEILATADESLAVIYFLWSLVLFMPGLAVMCRRMHDNEYSGWNYCWCFTGIGAIYVLYLLLKPTCTEPNKYGPVAPIQ